MYSFLNWITEAVTHHYSLFIFELFSNWWILLTFCFLILILFNWLIRKIRKGGMKIFLNIILLSILYFLFIFSFLKGERFNNLKNLGTKIIFNIQDFESRNEGKIPIELDEIKNNLNYNEKLMIDQNFKYETIFLKDSTKGFILELRPVDLKYSYYIYNEEKHDFVETD